MLNTKLLSIVCISVMSISCHAENYQEQPEVATEKKVTYRLTLETYPDTITIAGIRLPLEDQEVRERFEREFYNILHNDNVNVQTVTSANYLIPEMKSILSEMGIHSDLIYLSYAETNLRFAKSTAGAAGLWQLMELIGKAKGLRMDYWVDERYHIDKSTRASVSFIQDLFRKYKDWNLAIAAYNVGETIISDQLKFQHTNNFFDLFLNEETTRYVLRIYAMKVIFEQPERYGLPAYNFITKPFDEITVTGPIPNLAYFALQNGTTYRQLRIHNQWIKRRNLPEGKWTLRLPSDRIKQSDALKSYNYPKIQEFANATSRIIDHKVLEGETIFSVSLKYDVEISEIMRWNKLDSQEFKTGQMIKIQLW